MAGQPASPAHGGALFGCDHGANRNQKSLLQGKLAGQRRVRHCVSKANPGGGRRKLQADLREGFLEALVLFHEIAQAQHELIVRATGHAFDAKGPSEPTQSQAARPVR